MMLMKVLARQAQQVVTVQCSFDPGAQGSRALVLRCLNLNGIEVDTLNLDLESTVADLKHQWNIDDARFTREHQLRIARDFNAYTYSEFAQHYGKEQFEQRWREAWPVYLTPEFTRKNQRRIACDSKAYSFSEFAHYYDAETCEHMWHKARPVWPVDLTPERLQLPGRFEERFGYGTACHVREPCHSQVQIVSPAGRLLAEADPAERIASWIELQ
jgi:hypothetical protein